MKTGMARDLMLAEEWRFFEHFILTVRAPNGRKPNNHRLVLVGVFWISWTGAPWRDLPEEFGRWSRVYRQLEPLLKDAAGMLSAFFLKYLPQLVF